MGLKIELIPPNGLHPPLLVVDDDTIFPIVDLGVRGKTNEDPPNVEKPFYLIKGCLLFQDIFGQIHKIDYDEDKEEEMKNDRRRLWKNRMAILDQQRIDDGKEPETNPLKRMFPGDRENIPMEDWPQWRRDCWKLENGGDIDVDLPDDPPKGGLGPLDFPPPSLN